MNYKKAKSLIVNITSIITFLLLITFEVNAKNQQGRMGIGMTEELANDIPAISFKLQRSDNFCIGALLGLKYSTSNSGYGLGLKFYRIIFDEPNLNFYMSGSGILLNTSLLDFSTIGFQVDGSLGAEVYFSGLDSVGFSFEFGLSVFQNNETFTFTTNTNRLLKAGVHFYL